MSRLIRLPLGVLALIFRILKKKFRLLVIKAYLLDCDGTIVDSDPSIDKAVAQAITTALRQKGRLDFEHTAAQNKARFRGYTFLQILTTIAAEESITFTPAELESIHSAYELEKCRILKLEAQPAPGVKEALFRLQQAGVRLAVVSSSSKDAIRACLEGAGLTEFFFRDGKELIFSGLDLGHPKPEPHAYLEAMRVLGLHPDQCVAVEDTLSGVESARAAGLQVFHCGACIDIADQEAHRSKCRDHTIGYIPHWDKVS